MTTIAERDTPASVALSAQPIPVAELVARAPRAGVRVVIRSYVALTKPRIVELLLVTTVPAMFLARTRLSPLWLTLVVLVGGGGWPRARPTP
jgi:protoheme IX farnesyltransferase